MYGDRPSEANRNAALDRLRASRQQQYPIQGGPSHQFYGQHHQQQSYQSYTPPAQSRDASGAGQWNHNPNHYQQQHIGNVLVPGSSPPRPEVPYTTYHGTPQRPQGAPFQIPGLPMPANNPWQRGPTPSHTSFQGHSNGFSQPNHAMNGSQSRNTHSNGSYSGQGSFDDPYAPRLKRHRPDDSQANLMASPPSPDVLRPGQRRRVTSMAGSSDDSFTDVTAPSRLARHRPSEDSPVSADAVKEAQYQRFKMTMPMHSPDLIKAAWDQANGDAKVATNFLYDDNWKPKTLAPPTAIHVSPTRPPPAAEDTGRNKDIDDATQRARAAAREKGKKSAIYQNRPTIDLTKSSPVKAGTSTPQRAPTPPSPVFVMKRKRAKKIVDSDSDGAYADSDDDRRGSKPSEDNVSEIRALSYLNTAAPDAIQELTGCTPVQAQKILELRPFQDVDDLNTKLQQGKKKAGPAGISSRMFSECVNVFSGYGAVDDVLADCERIGAALRKTIISWTSSSSEERDENDGAISLIAISAPTNNASKDCLVKQPALLSDSIQLKDYQLSGVSWLRLLYRKQLSCILADEMGLGKTAQVISFFASLKEQGIKGPHLVVVPSSTLENWVREFGRFAPSISVQTYYAGKEERPMLRQTLIDTQAKSHAGGWEVLITTYNLAQGDEKDRKFFRKMPWNCCVFDEGHVLKNFNSQRYQALMKYEAHWRLLLTGTPLQNNLQELVSLMSFILPDTFADTMDSLRAIFKVKGDHKVSLLAQERVSRAKKMMTPFVLRRRKDQVLKDLPKKIERIEWCDMTSLQRSIYRDALQRSRKTIMAVEEPDLLDDDPAPKARKAIPKKKPAKKDKKQQYAENSSNVLMDLRKAALHPMLFRKRFDNTKLEAIVRALLREPEFKKRGATYQYCYEDMEVMTDSEIQVFLPTYKSTSKFVQDDSMWVDAAKVTVLLRLLEEYKSQGRKVLVFSQFTQVLDILVKIFNMKDYKHLILTGTTPVDVRQSLVDEFSEDDSLSVFLLSTKAGGMGINLTAASVVIMFDQDFNPHNDRQAQDRAYRIGQKVDVDVIKLITKGTIEEDMLRLGQTKLALDEAVAGDPEEGGESEAAKQMRAGLMNTLRQHFAEEEDGGKDDTKEEDTKAKGVDGAASDLSDLTDE